MAPGELGCGVDVGRGEVAPLVQKSGVASIAERYRSIYGLLSGRDRGKMAQLLLVSQGRVT